MTDGNMTKLVQNIGDAIRAEILPIQILTLLSTSAMTEQIRQKTRDEHYRKVLQATTK